MLALLGGTVEVLYHAGTIHAWLRNVDAARDWILQHGFWPSVLAFFAANLLLCAAGFPRLWTSVFAGAVFGGTLGLGLSLPSSVLGTCLTFFGARGIGEHPVVGVAPAVINAIQDAIGVEFQEIPVTPEKVLAALAARK